MNILSFSSNHQIASTFSIHLLYDLEYSAQICMDFLLWSFFFWSFLDFHIPCSPYAFIAWTSCPNISFCGLCTVQKEKSQKRGMTCRSVNNDKIAIFRITILLRHLSTNIYITVTVMFTFTCFCLPEFSFLVCYHGFWVSHLFLVLLIIFPCVYKPSVPSVLCSASSTSMFNVQCEYSPCLLKALYIYLPALHAFLVLCIILHSDYGTITPSVPLNQFGSFKSLCWCVFSK